MQNIKSGYLSFWEDNIYERKGFFCQKDMTGGFCSSGCASSRCPSITEILTLNAVMFVRVLQGGNPMVLAIILAKFYAGAKGEHDCCRKVRN